MHCLHHEHGPQGHHQEAKEERPNQGLCLTRKKAKQNRPFCTKTGAERRNVLWNVFLEDPSSIEKKLILGRSELVKASWRHPETDIHRTLSEAAYSATMDGLLMDFQEATGLFAVSFDCYVEQRDPAYGHADILYRKSCRCWSCWCRQTL